uniref:Protein FAM221A n=1 Tax=Dunaliella tertiolecta TaxID=3047 RepID=A0A7S3VH60_DUNTE|mmetsp:Transcript_5941/g.15787  ORF Transcript_5941/g.15787 Transcript_5941/m.15787 type:complete len:438 (-) Transcript_5941:15-1328(-)
MLQPRDRNAVAAAVSQYGVAPGARKMMDWEEEAAEQAISTGMYVTFRSSPRMDCTRVGPHSKCFCGHLYSEHSFISKKSVYPRCHNCECTGFQFIPRRPEEVGDWWLVRRKGFNVHTWRAKCKCGHSHEEHHPTRKRCQCGCPQFQSNFACLACDKKWEDHETFFETTADRMAAGLPVGDAFRPLMGDEEIRGQVFPSGTRSSGDPSQHAASGASSFQPNRLRPAAVPASRAEKSVQIMHESSGGRLRGQDTVNAYGKVANPPQEWLFGGGGDGLSRLDKPGGSGGSGRNVEDPRASSRRVAGSAEASTSQYGAYSGCRVGGEMAGATREIRPPAGMSTLPSAARPKQSLGAMLIQSGASAQGAQAWHEDELGEGAGEAGYGGRSVHNSYGGGGRGGVQTAGVERDTGVGPQRPGSGASTQRSSRQGAPSGFKGVYD